jgi:hypothetical protein
MRARRKLPRPSERGTGCDWFDADADFLIATARHRLSAAHRGGVGIVRRRGRSRGSGDDGWKHRRRVDVSPSCPDGGLDGTRGFSCRHGDDDAIGQCFAPTESAAQRLGGPAAAAPGHVTARALGSVDHTFAATDGGAGRQRGQSRYDQRERYAPTGRRGARVPTSSSDARIRCRRATDLRGEIRTDKSRRSKHGGRRHRAVSGP